MLQSSRQRRPSQALRRSTFGVPSDSSDEEDDLSETESSVTSSSEEGFGDSEPDEAKPQLLSVPVLHAPVRADFWRAGDRTDEDAPHAT